MNIGLTYEDYKLLGGTCPESLFERCKMQAEAMLKKTEAVYTIVCSSEEARTLMLVSLIDSSFVDYNNVQNGNVSSIRVGSYSETRQADGSNQGATLRAMNIIRQFCHLYQKPVGVIL